MKSFDHNLELFDSNKYIFQESLRAPHTHTDAIPPQEFDSTDANSNTTNTTSTTNNYNNLHTDKKKHPSGPQ